MQISFSHHHSYILGSAAQLLLLGLPIISASRSSCVREVWWRCGDVPLGSGVVARGDMCELCCLCLYGTGSDGQSAYWNGSRLAIDSQYMCTVYVPQ